MLDAIARKEELRVGEAELTEQIVRRAQQAGMRADEYAQQVVSSGQLGSLMGEVLRGKALALVLEHATITDASGRPVDLDELDQGARAAMAPRPRTPRTTAARRRGRPDGPTADRRGARPRRPTSRTRPRQTTTETDAAAPGAALLR